MTTSEIQGTKILLVGYGRENQSVHRFLARHFPNVQVNIADKHPIKPINPVASILEGDTYLKTLSTFDTIVRSPGIPSTTPELAAYKGKQTTATNIFFSVVPTQHIIGITGTKGKSTTSSLIAALLKAKHPDVRLVGNIGTPALDFVDNVHDKTIFVVELSSHQLEDCRYSPHIAVVLNVVAEHLDYYKNFEEYKQAKSKIALFQKEDHTIIYNPSHIIPKKIASLSKARHVTYTIEPNNNTQAWVEQNTLMRKAANSSAETIMPTAEIPLLGKGNIENILAAITTTTSYNLSNDQIRQAIRGFKGLTHRLEKVGVYRGITFYNDSLATIPDATIHALEALGDNVETLIIGGYNRGVGYTNLANYISTLATVKTLILFPDTGKIIWGSLSHKEQFQKFDVTTMQDAVRIAYQQTTPGKVCLLSPASASFNLFKDYADRGKQFKKYIIDLQ